MLKWLAGQRPPEPRHVVTDDPLATINVHSKAVRAAGIYAVSRVNPLFDEADEGQRKDGGVGVGVGVVVGASEPAESPAKSGSSGYGGNSSECSSSSRSSSADEDASGAGGRRDSGAPAPSPSPTPTPAPAAAPADPSAAPATTVLRDDALTVLEQNAGFVKGILVAVRGGRGSNLSTIPEGKVDYCIPRPVWPRRDQALPLPLPPTLSSAPPDSLLDEELLLYTSLTDRRALLRDEARPVGDAAPLQQESAEEALRKLSLTLSSSQHLTRMTRALSRGSSCSMSGAGSREGSSRGSVRESTPGSSGGFSSSATSSSAGSLRGETLAVGAATRWGQAASALAPSPTPTSTPSAAPASPAIESGCASGSAAKSPSASASSSSSADSTSGYSELPPTPPRSQWTAGRRPPAGGLMPPPATAPAAVRNALIYGTLGRGPAYEKLLAAAAAAVSAPALEDAVWRKALEVGPAPSAVGVAVGDVRQPKDDHLYRPPSARPDFTLDVPNAERLLQKIREAKQRRCWCRLFTCLLGLIVFMLTVVVVSMLLTRGQRVFGPL